MSVVVENDDFRYFSSPYLHIFLIKGHNYYTVNIVDQWLFSYIEIGNLE